jgi:hypothetical protein
MTDIALVTDHTEEALALLIETYKGLPRLSGLVASITKRLQEFEDINWDVINKRLLDYTDRDGNAANAVAAQLDTIGRIVGRGRNGQDDATYLIYIRAQIFLNKSRAFRGDVVTLLLLIEPTLVFAYTEYYPCVVVLEFASAPVTDPNILQELAQLAVTGGVRVVLIAPPPGASAAHSFAFSFEGAASDPLRAFSFEGSAAYGGVFSAEYT